MGSFICESVCLEGIVGPTLYTTSWIQDYAVHHRAALCTMVHKGNLCPFEVGVAPNIFHVLMVHKEHAKSGHYFREETLNMTMLCTTDLCCAP